MQQKALIAVVCVLGFYSVAAITADYQADKKHGQQTAQPVSYETLGGVISPLPAAIPGSASASDNPVVRAVTRVGPAVVNIDTVVMKPRFSLPGPLQDYFSDDLFFGKPMPQNGQGSGVIIDGKRGYILTNEHVVHDVRARNGRIKISLPNKQMYEGELIGADQMSDLALVKIDGTDLPQATLAPTDDLVIGSTAIAIGNPFGFHNSVTVGVVSATGRTLSTSNNSQLENLIQTDAAINPGNSGGPLCDIEGNIIGLNTAIIPYGQGIGFAISVGAIKGVVDELIKYGRVRRPWTGMYYYDLSVRAAKRLGLDKPVGALVAEILNDSPAGRAGIKPGDVILAVDGKSITSVEDMQRFMLKAKVEQTIKLTVWRDGKKKTISMKLEEPPANLRR